MLKKLKKMYPHQTLMMIFIIGLLISSGSFIVEYVFKVQPCDMCLWQRYLAIAITIVAFIGTLFRGKIKKLFLATIALLALASLTVGLWQSLAQYDIVALPTACQAPEVAQTTDAQDLLANVQNNQTNYIDCSKKEDFFLYNTFGITLANVNVILMILIGGFSFYKLFFKPKRRFRNFKRYNNNRNGNRQNNNNRRYRGSGYNRSNNRNKRQHTSYNKSN